MRERQGTSKGGGWETRQQFASDVESRLNCLHIWEYIDILRFIDIYVNIYNICRICTHRYMYDMKTEVALFVGRKGTSKGRRQMTRSQ